MIYVFEIVDLIESLIDFYFGLEKKDTLQFFVFECWIKRFTEKEGIFIVIGSHHLTFHISMD